LAVRLPVRSTLSAKSPAERFDLFWIDIETEHSKTFLGIGERERRAYVPEPDDTDDRLAAIYFGPEDLFLTRFGFW